MCGLGVGAWRRRAVSLAVLEQCAGRSGRLLPVPDGYRRAHGQQAQAQHRSAERRDTCYLSHSRK
ncbi:hypothetical protein ACFP72_05845 [Pseudomonas spelaei]|uniref:hypothetical protein n=1 Tax=Pseudomonas spelaei TaxID=1055469 RepID=UPI003607CC40